jgi:hypothetical protein
MPKPSAPIACSLSAAELPERLAEMTAVGRSSLLTAETASRHAVLRFRAGADTSERLAAIVAAERECCAFLAMELRDEPGAIALTIDAPESAQPVLDDLVAAFRG